MALQCAIPVFDGLFKPHNNAIVMDLLFELATWHALAKLRLHTESTICALETSTTQLGSALRKFQSTICAELLEIYQVRKQPEDGGRQPRQRRSQHLQRGRESKQRQRQSQHLRKRERKRRHQWGKGRRNPRSGFSVSRVTNHIHLVTMRKLSGCLEPQMAIVPR